MRSALNTLRLPEETQSALLRLLAALLHLGNVKFGAEDDKEKGVEGSKVVREPVAKGAKESSAQAVAQLLQVVPQALHTALTSRLMVTQRGSSYSIPLKPAEAEDARDALATAIFCGIFSWLVARVNTSIEDAVAEHANTVSDDDDDDDEEEAAAEGSGSASSGSPPAGGRRRQRSSFAEIMAEQDADARRRGQKTRLTVGILDVFGFEDLETNSFEQLCINFTNEKLQAHFTAAVFKETQMEYEEEGIDVASIGFRDNDAQVQLMDGRPFGMLSLLEEECHVPRGSDLGFLGKVDEQHGKGRNAFFVRPKVRKADMEDAFVLKHYAGEVTYHVAGWLEKSRGFLRADMRRLLITSDCHLLTNLPGVVEDEPKEEASSGGRGRGGRGGGGGKRNTTVGTKFAAELTQLVTLLNSVSSRFIRCLKPNMLKRCDCFDGEAVLRQLRYTGMLECIHIRRSGFPIKVPRNSYPHHTGSRFLFVPHPTTHFPRSRCPSPNSSRKWHHSSR